ncbi:amidohydrolase family protein [Cellulomonas sp. ICMP 17802]|uniref:amidohydrolase family protein n=1 Tax=Cellulomonas sp. ICMP 17802 TaxID=3239199 RepID=UPI00351AE5B4
MATPDWTAAAHLRLADWQPRSRLAAATTRVERSAVACIDVHNHLGRWLTPPGWTAPSVDELLALMDRRNVAAIVNLDGMHGDELEANLDRYDRAHPDRFVTFCQLDWGLLAQPSGAELLAAQLRDCAARGARGVKVWKNLGLSVRDESGALVLPDDPRVVSTLALAGSLGLPVLIHTADPMAFFDPVDASNERIDELQAHPDWWFGDRDVHPTFDRLMTALETLVLATPGTTYVGAHVGCCAEDLDRVEQLLAAAPNWHVDIGGRMAELGRQPRRTRRLIERFGDRVLFGTDAFPLDDEALTTHFRFLETEDEAFDYAPGEAVPPQGRWTVSGLGLGADALEALYAGNARRVLGL